MAISGNAIIVGADDKGRKGAAYVFIGRGLLWRQVAKLTPSDVESVNYFGQSVSIS